MSKRYYWLKLHKDFFSSPRIKKLRSIAGGNTYTIIYLKLLLHTIDTDGVVEFQGIEPTISEELSLVLDEDAENIGLCLNFLNTVGLVETSDGALFFPEAVKNTGSETAVSQRVRDFRKRQKETKVLHCNTDVTKCNTDVTQVKRMCNAEKEKELETEIESENKKTLGQTPCHPQASDTVVLTENEIWFDEFWSVYPRRVAKATAQKSFKKMCTSEKVFGEIMDGLRKQIPTWKDPKYIPHPATWLNNRRWEDEEQTEWRLPF